VLVFCRLRGLEVEHSWAVVVAYAFSPRMSTHSSRYPDQTTEMSTVAVSRAVNTADGPLVHRVALLTFGNIAKGGGGGLGPGGGVGVEAGVGRGVGVSTGVCTDVGNAVGPGVRCGGVVAEGGVPGCGGTAGPLLVDPPAPLGATSDGLAGSDRLVLDVANGEGEGRLDVDDDALGGWVVTATLALGTDCRSRTLPPPALAITTAKPARK
jgi:hypothetical protein